MSTAAPIPAPRQATLPGLLVSILLHALGVGLLMPVLPVLIGHLTGADFSSSSVYGGLLTSLYAGAQFFAAPILGSLSDRFGRRRVLMASYAAFSAHCLLIGFSTTLNWVYAAELLAGTFAAATSAGSAYIADISDTGSRARRFGIMGATYGAGLAIAPTLSGWLVVYGIRVPCFVAALLAVINVMYVLWVLPESLARESRRPFEWAQSHALSVLRQLRLVPGVSRLLVAMLLFQIGIQTLPTTWPYFAMQEFEWTVREVGYSLSLFGITTIITQGLVVGRLTAVIGINRTVYAGFVLLICGFLGFALVGEGRIASLCIVPAGMGLMTGPALTSLMANRLGASTQGILQGAVASAISLAAILTPLVMPQIFRAFSQANTAARFPGAPYLIAAALAMCSLFIVRTSLPTLTTSRT